MADSILRIKSKQSIDTNMLSAECDEIRKILISSVNTLKSKQKPDAVEPE